LRYNGATATATTDNMDMSGYPSVTFNYRYAESNMDGGTDDFMIQYSTNGGSNWTTVQTIVPNDGNGVWINT
jgi:hypothetical protein